MSRTEAQDWVARRAKAVLAVYSAFDALTENGIELQDRGEDMQIPCPFHNDTRPSARYYARGGIDSRFHCFKCKYHLHGIDLFMKFKNLDFMTALVELERRFRIKVPRRPEAPDIKDPIDRSSGYVSDAWSDAPRVVKILEARLPKIRGVVPMSDYVKFCRVLDSVQWDLDRSEGVTTPDMVQILNRVKAMMEEASVRSADASLIVDT